MPTNKNLSAALVASLRAAGYDPQTPEEWIISAMDYLHNSSSHPDTVPTFTKVLTENNSAGNLGITNLASISSSADLDLTGVVGDILLDDWTFDTGVGLVPLVNGAMNIGSISRVASAIYTNQLIGRASLSLATNNNGSLNVTINGTGAFHVVGLDDYATNAAALAGGLVAGDLYYTNIAGEATLKIVI